MRFISNSILFLCAFLVMQFNTNAQEWPSPEVAQMYRHAGDYMSMGNYKDAIVTYKQAIVLAPGKFLLYRDLGRALYLSGSYADAVKVLQPYENKKEADETFYDLLAASDAALNDGKKAATVLKKGIIRFPASGLLYRDLGHLYDLEKRPEQALEAWVEGINEAPGYAQNYYDAARKYLSGEDVMQGLLYGEIYLNISQDSSAADTLKKLLFVGYKTMFDDITSRITTKLGEGDQPANSFMDAVEKTYLSLTPVVSDGITTENLTMVRTRFLMSWFDKYAGKYPYSLFSYQDYLLKNGLFDIYNEWLFGKAESITEYNAWQQFHAGEMDIFMEKKRTNGLHPKNSDAYNTSGMDLGGKNGK